MKICVLLESKISFICTYSSFIFPNFSSSRKVFLKMKRSRIWANIHEKGEKLFTEKLSSVREVTNKCLTFPPYFLERDSGLRNKMTKLSSLIISAFKLTWWLVGVLKVYARNSLASQGSEEEADKITRGTGTVSLTPLALPSENISSWNEDESSFVSKA